MRRSGVRSSSSPPKNTSKINDLGHLARVAFSLGRPLGNAWEMAATRWSQASPAAGHAAGAVVHGSAAPGSMRVAARSAALGAAASAGMKKPARGGLGYTVAAGQAVAAFRRTSATASNNPGHSWARPEQAHTQLPCISSLCLSKVSKPLPPTICSIDDRCARRPPSCDCRAYAAAAGAVQQTPGAAVAHVHAHGKTAGRNGSHTANLAMGGHVP